MEVKKNPNYDLEKKRGLFLQIGLLVSLLVVLMAFEYESPVEPIADLDFEILEEMDEMIPITVQDQPKPKELPKFKPIELTTIILADDEEEVIDLEITDSDASEDDFYDITAIEEEVEPTEEVPFVRVEQMPIFNPKKNKTYEQGVKDLFVTMQKMTKYPTIAAENGIQGKVFVRFVVTKTGKIDNVKVMRKGDPALDNEAIRVVKNLPSFKPGMQRNKPVSVWFSGYISFVLQ